MVRSVELRSQNEVTDHWQHDKRQIGRYCINLHSLLPNGDRNHCEHNKGYWNCIRLANLSYSSWNISMCGNPSDNTDSINDAIVKASLNSWILRSWSNVQTQKVDVQNKKTGRSFQLDADEYSMTPYAVLNLFVSSFYQILYCGVSL